MVRAAEIVVHRRSRAARIHICGAKMRDGILVVHGPKVDAVAGDSARIRHRLVQMSAGEQDEPAGGTNDFDRVDLDVLLRLRLLPGIRLDVFGRFGPRCSVPLAVIIDCGIILQWSVKIFRINPKQFCGTISVMGSHQLI